MGDVLSTRLHDADLRLPTKPPSKAAVTRSSAASFKPLSIGATTAGGTAGPGSAGAASTGGGSFIQPRTFSVGL